MTTFPYNQLSKSDIMRYTIILLLSTSLFFSCNEGEIVKVASSETSGKASDEKIDLPYTVEKTPDWEKGPASNVAVAMNTLKSYETNNFDNMKNYLADSVSFYFDYGYLKGERDSVIMFMKEYRDGLSSVTINMRDYESVKSKSRGEEWVSLWYTETSTDKAGKTDSVMCMDDVMIKDGKVTMIDSKIRRLVRQE